MKLPFRAKGNFAARKLRLLSAVLAAFVLALGFAPGASATTLERLSLAQMARAADLVVRARCAAASSRWERGSIWTIDTFEVIESFKGAPPAQLQVRLPGGRVGNLQMNVEAAPRFQPGEEGVLFLEQTTLGDYSVTGWAQGTFRVRKSVAAGQSTVTQDSSGLPVFDTVTHRFTNEGIRNLSLDQFRARLTSALAQGSAGGKS